MDEDEILEYRIQASLKKFIIFFKLVVIYIKLYYDVFSGLVDTDHYKLGAQNTFLTVEEFLEYKKAKSK